VLHEGYKEMEITGYEICAVDLVIHNLPAVVLYPVTSPTDHVEPCGFYVFGSQKKHLTEKQSATDANVR